MKQNADFQEGISQAWSTITPLPTPKFLTTNENFEMRYYVKDFPKGAWKLPMVKAKSSEKLTF